MKSYKELDKELKIAQEIEKNNIRKEPNKFKRFWKWLGYLVIYPFKRIFVNVRDVKTLIIFTIVFLIVSCEVWIPYLIGIICWSNEALRNTMFGVASTCLLFWNLPLTPFLPICIALTMLIKSLLNCTKNKKQKNNL